MLKSKWTKPTQYCNCGRKARGGYNKCTWCINAKDRKKLETKRTKIIEELYKIEKKLKAMNKKTKRI